MEENKRSHTHSWDAEHVRRATRQTEADSGHTPQKKRRKHFNVPIYIAAVVLGSMLLAGIGWLLANDLCAFNKPELTAEVTIEKGDSLGKVAGKLKKAGLIDFKLFFMMYGGVTGAMDKIDPGTYELNTDMDYRSLVGEMYDPDVLRREQEGLVLITIPEGYTVAQIIDLLAENGVSTKEELEDAAANFDFGEEYSFIDNNLMGRVNRLEGYLFPDTYEFSKEKSAVFAIDTMLTNFVNRTSDLMDAINSSSYNLREIITLASVVEREAIGDDEERANIASVFYNRLNGGNSEVGTVLQSDATIYYALRVMGLDDSQFSTDLDSPYNTYKYGGLPAGPICNPSLSAIRAAIYPNDTDYYYFAYGKDGVSHFFRTYNEHLAFVNSDMYAPD